jgi:hypothetical protein
MKKLVLAAIATLSLGIGAAMAAQPTVNSMGQIVNGPAYSNDAAGG